MCAVSKPKKSKGKAKSGTSSPTPEPAASVVEVVAEEEVVQVIEEKAAPATKVRDNQRFRLCVWYFWMVALT